MMNWFNKSFQPAYAASQLRQGRLGPASSSRFTRDFVRDDEGGIFRHPAHLPRPPFVIPPTFHVLLSSSRTKPCAKRKAQMRGPVESSFHAIKECKIVSIPLGPASRVWRYRAIRCAG